MLLGLRHQREHLTPLGAGRPETAGTGVGVVEYCRARAADRVAGAGGIGRPGGRFLYPRTLCHGLIQEVGEKQRQYPKQPFRVRGLPGRTDLAAGSTVQLAQLDNMRSRVEFTALKATQRG